jgi:hypothetical protein
VKKHRAQYGPLRAPRPLPWWKNYLQLHPLQSAIVSFTSLGAMILLAYFVHLGVLPDLDWAGTNALLLYTALIAMTLSGYVSLFTIGPGWFTRIHGPEVKDLQQGWTGPALLLLPSIAFALGLLSNEVPEKSCALEALFAAALLVGLGYSNLDLHTKQLRCIELLGKLNLFVSYFALSIAWFFNLILATLIFCALSGREINNLLLSIWLIFCIAINLIVLKTEKLTYSLLWLGAAIGLLVLAMLTGNGIAIPKAVIRSLGMGDLPVSLLVTEAGCNQINQISGQTVCEVDPLTKNAIICPVLLRSRIASPYFIGLLTQRDLDRWPLAHSSDTTAATSSVSSGPWQTIALRPSEVLSWSRIQFTSSNTESRSEASTVVVSHLNATSHGHWIKKQCGSGQSSISK